MRPRVLYLTLALLLAFFCIPSVTARAATETETETPKAAPDTSKLCETAYQTAINEFAAWTFDSPPQPRPEQLVSPDFLAQIESKIGPVQIDVKRDLSGGWLYRVFAKHEGSDQQIMTWALYRVKKEPQSIRLDRLELTNPIAPTDRLRLSQEKKGIPITAFRFLRGQLFKMFRAGGYHRVNSHGTQNYSALMIDRKIVGMRGRTEAAEKAFEFLDRVYQFAKTSLPEDVRPKTLDDFSRMLGDVDEGPAGYSAISAAWEDYQREGTLASGIDAIRDSSGEIVSLVDRRQHEGLPAARAYFIDRLNPKHPILQWLEIADGKAAQLSMEIPSP